MARKRKNPNPARKERKVVERGYFHTGNSGITISMVEQVQNYDWDERDRNYFEHTLEIHHSAFGAGTTIQTPIAGPLMCDYYIEAFERLKARMLSYPDYRIPNAFDRYDPKGANNGLRIVDIANGMKREQVWSHEIITGPNHTSSSLLGFIYRKESGLPDRAEANLHPEDDGSGCDSGSNSSEAMYSPSDIGKPLNAVKKRKLEQLAKELGADVDIPEDDGFPTVEQVACVVARTFGNVGFMQGPISKSTFTGNIVEALSFKFETTGKTVTAELLGEEIRRIIEERVTKNNSDGPTYRAANVHIYTISEVVLPEGYRVDPETFELDTETWHPEYRHAFLRFGIEY